MKLKAKVGELLRHYAGEVIPGALGYSISCPFHEDHRPSAIVFYDTGIFSCFSGCGAKPLVAGLRKLGVPDEVIAEFGEAESLEDKPRISPLTVGEWGAEKDAVEGTVGIVSEEPWQAGWGYRGIRAVSLTSTESLMVKTFKPSLVRLWVGSKGKIHQEHYSRLCLHYAQHQIFLRLSSEQETKVYNSPGLSLKDPRLPPFGMSSFTLPKNQAGVILVEGPYDLMRTVQNLEELGVGGDFTVIALLGVSHWDAFLGKLELRLLPQLGDTPLILAFDNDKAGVGVTRQALADCKTRLLLPKGQLRLLKYESHDPGDMGKDELKRGLLGMGY